MGSRAARRLQPGDLFVFTTWGIAYRQATHPSGVVVWEHETLAPDTCGILMARPSREETLQVELALGDGYEIGDNAPDEWMPCLIAGERLLICGLERAARRLNRRSP